MHASTTFRAQRVRYRSDVLVIKVAGDVDLSTAPQFADALAAADAEIVVVDLAEVTFLAVTGLRLLVEAAYRASSHGSRFGVVAHDRTALRLLRMSEAAASIPVFPALSDAIRELPGHPVPDRGEPAVLAVVQRPKPLCEAVSG
ncbi:STAS domain-containing protein [Actinokineospora sp. NPDC004072]